KDRPCAKAGAVKGDAATMGLVTFTLDKAQPDYAVVVLPALAAPDMFYVNNMLDRLKANEPALLNSLF
ncbi:hypothetical protein, partial [Aestuariivirga sp.]|uniref:hypothetical protein n=1 Tax=Aestuariivirga sp. TaxID=2650926 RepID=UPI003015970B